MVANMDLTTSYRYNQNMMEYYTCNADFKKLFVNSVWSDFNVL